MSLRRSAFYLTLDDAVSAQLEFPKKPAFSSDIFQQNEWPWLLSPLADSTHIMLRSWHPGPNPLCQNGTAHSFADGFLKAQEKVDPRPDVADFESRQIQTHGKMEGLDSLQSSGAEM